MTAFHVAAVFDRIDDQGRPYFSPERQRIVGRTERARVHKYLISAPMVLRANGMETDPLADGSGRVVPLHYRTDGEWVWQEACGYYLQEYGVAPEDSLLSHISARGFLAPARLSPDVLQAAGAAALVPGAGALPLSAASSAFRYLARVAPEQPPSALIRMFWGAQGTPVAEELRSDLTWWPTSQLPFLPPGVAPPLGFTSVSERQASSMIDLWWRAAAGSAN